MQHSQDRFLQPLAAYLQDLDHGRVSRSPQVRIEESRIDEEALRVRFDEGVTFGRACAEVDAARRLQELQDEHEARMAAARIAWDDAFATRTAGQIEEGLRRLRDDIALATAQALEIWLAVEMRDRAVEQVMETIRSIELRLDGMDVRLVGPSDLTDRIRQAIEVQFRGSSPNVRCEAGDETDVRFEAGDTVIKTQVGAWMTRVLATLEMPKRAAA